MKFARLLRTTAEDLPELQCLFHIYKHLKKQLKQLPARAEGASAVGQQLKADEGTTATASSAPDDEEAKFTVVLTDHLQRLNDRFLEREETCVIQLERLEAEAAQCTATARAASAGLAVATAAAAAAANGTAAPEETYTVGGAPPQVDGKVAAAGDVGAVATGDAAATGAGSAGDAGVSPAAAAAAVAAADSRATLKAVTEQRAQLYKRFVNFHGRVHGSGLGVMTCMAGRLDTTSLVTMGCMRVAVGLCLVSGASLHRSHINGLHCHMPHASLPFPVCARTPAQLPVPTTTNTTRTLIYSRAPARATICSPGEVLLLVHWSVLAYTATVKILKKHHKRTGLLLRAPQLGDLLSQPFCSSEVCFGESKPRGVCVCVCVWVWVCVCVRVCACAGGFDEVIPNSKCTEARGGGGLTTCPPRRRNPCCPVSSCHNRILTASPRTASALLTAAALLTSRPPLPQLMTGLARKAEACIQRLAEQLASSATSDGTGGTGDGTGGGGGGPQDTVDQAAPGAGAGQCTSTGKAAEGHFLGAGGGGVSGGAGGMLPDGDSYGVADGSSPSCSQSLGELPAAMGAEARRQQLKRRAPAASPEADAERAGEDGVGEAAATGPSGGKRSGFKARRASIGDGFGEAAGPSSDGGGGAAGAQPGGAFLRHLARLSDNASAASLSGPNVLEQLVELQQIVVGPLMGSGRVCVGFWKGDERASGACGGMWGQVGVGRFGPVGPCTASLYMPCYGLAITQDEYDKEDDEDDEDDDTDDSGALAAGADARTRAGSVAGPSAAVLAVGADAAAAAARAVAVATRRETSAPAADATTGTSGRCTATPGAGMGAGGGGAAAPMQLDGTAPRVAAAPGANGVSGSGSGSASGAAAPGLASVGAGQAAAAGQPGGGNPSGSRSGSGSGPMAAAAGPGAPLQGPAATVDARKAPPPQSSSGSAAAGAGAATGGAAASTGGMTGSEAAFAAPLPAVKGNLLRRTQVALTMWEHLRTSASTPSTVIDPAAGQQGHSQGGGGAAATATPGGSAVEPGVGKPGGGETRSKRQRAAPGQSVEQESVGDDSDSNSD